MNNGPKIVIFVGIVLCVAVYSVSLHEAQMQGHKTALVAVNRVDMESLSGAGIMLALNSLIADTVSPIIKVYNFQCWKEGLVLRLFELLFLMLMLLQIFFCL